MTIEEKNLILNETQIRQKVKRIAFEIYENNFQEKDVVVAGVNGQGYTLAQLLVENLKAISPFNLLLAKVSLNKQEPLKSSVELDKDLAEVSGKCIVIVDDVLYTGRTFLQSLKPFLNTEIKKIQTAVLIDRSHKQFPVSADYTGYELSTTIDEHVKVSLDQGALGVYLY